MCASQVLHQDLNMRKPISAVYGTSLRDSRCVPAYGRTPSVCCCWGVYAISRPEQGSIGISFWPFNPGRKFGRRRSEFALRGPKPCRRACLWRRRRSDGPTRCREASFICFPGVVLIQRPGDFASYPASRTSHLTTSRPDRERLGNG